MDEDKMEESKVFLAETDEEFARKSAYDAGCLSPSKALG